MDKKHSTPNLGRDLGSALVVFLVAIPLCLGLAIASHPGTASTAPLFSGLLAGVIGGVVVGALSGSQVAVAGPAAGLTAIVAAQISSLGSFQAFLLAVLFAGLIQVLMGLARVGFIAAFFPTSVVKGLLAAVGIILILKQIPHLLGHDTDPEGEMSFQQVDAENTITELGETVYDLHSGAILVGAACLLLLFLWDRIRWLRKSPVPAPLVAVLVGLGLAALANAIGGSWTITGNHLVQIPVAKTFAEMGRFFTSPDWSRLGDPRIYVAAFSLAMVASLEGMLNGEAVEKLDPLRRNSRTNRELIAMGCGNMLAGACGALPVTTVIVRSTVNIHAGATSRWSTIIHGGLIAVSVTLLPQWLNRIPIACLAAILFYTGTKLASPRVFRRMWEAGHSQFVPFVVTVAAIVLTDLMAGVLIGLITSFAFIIYSSATTPLKLVREKHVGGEVLRIELANQVSFINRAALTHTFDRVPVGGQVLIDARDTDYIDPDVLELIREFEAEAAPARKIKVSLLGFQERYHVRDRVAFPDHASKDVQRSMTHDEVLQMFRDGNERFREGRPLKRDLSRQVGATADGQFPLAVVLSCIDSRTPTELIFDLGVGDAFTIRIAGNVAQDNALGSIEYACAVAGAKLVLVLGHSRCGAVGAAVDLFRSGKTAMEATNCEHLDSIVGEIQESIQREQLPHGEQWTKEERERVVDAVARDNIRRMMTRIQTESGILYQLVAENKIAIVGGIYNIQTAKVKFFEAQGPVNGASLSTGKTMESIPTHLLPPGR